MGKLIGRKHAKAGASHFGKTLEASAQGAALWAEVILRLMDDNPGFATETSSTLDGLHNVQSILPK